ncbi:MAG: FlgO family outer membrane protein [candidate division Zixibacteria bacterium]|nr:FlgO family outer membrane protein [candidate division Zixibacteria bacterium]MDH4032163.1 FlgO family outer membrane protein [candidate division Zixibacteria bacterium]
MSDEKHDDNTRTHFVPVSGALVAHYRIVEKIGAGGMGEVFLAEDTELDRKVALKFLPAHLTADDDFAARFKREAQAAAKLNHPSIVTVHEVSEHRGRPFMAMEYVEGRPLSAVTADEKLSTDRIIDLAIQICDGLGKAHDAGVVHRDIKPSNIVLDSDLRPRLLDFGLATLRGSQSITERGSTIGTAAYMSPEQVQGETVDERSDLYSLGVTLYELITGQAPFRRDNHAATMQAIVTELPDPLARYRSDITEDLQRIVAKLMEKDPQMRYQSAAGVVSDLKLLQRDLSSGSYSLSGVTQRYQTQKRKRQRLYVMSFAVVAAAILVLVLNPFNLQLGGSGGVNAAENALAVLHFENLSDIEDEERLGQILQELVITDLSGLGSIKLISSQRLFDVQKQLGFRDRNRIDPAAASEVATKAGARTMLTGNLMRMKDQWVVTCQLIDLSDGTIIKSHKIDGNDLYAMVDDLTGRVRQYLVFTEAESAAVDLSIRDKTSSSIQAYRHYLAGIDFLGETEYTKAISEFQLAVKIDPQFNQAYYKMAIAQWWQEDVASGRGLESIRTLLAQGQYSSPREKSLLEAATLLIEQRYADAETVYDQLTDQYADDKECWYGLGEALYHTSNSKRAEALAAFETAIGLDAGFVLAYRHVFDVYEQRQDYERYSEAARKLIAAAPHAPAGYRYLSQAAIAVGDSTIVDQALSEALRRHPSDADRRRLFSAVADGCNTVGQYEKAESYVLRAIALDTDSSDATAWCSYGRTLFGLRRYDEANLAYLQSVRSDSTYRRAWDGLANLAYNRRDFANAIKYARKECRLGAGSPNSWRFLIHMCERAHRSAEADSAFEEGWRTISTAAGKINLIADVAQLYASSDRRRHRAAEVIKRGYPIVTSNTKAKLLVVDAQVCLNARLYDSAEQLALEAIEADAQRTISDWARAVVFDAAIYRGDWAQAEEVYANEPMVGSDKNRYSQQLQLLVYSERFDQVGELLQTALDSCPSLNAQFELLNNVSYYFSQTGQYDLALKHYQRANNHSPHKLWILDRIGRMQTYLNDYDAAEQTLRGALQQDSTRLFSKLYLSRVFYLQGRFNDALPWAQAAYRQDSVTVTVGRNLGYLYSYQGEFGQAIDYAESALARDSSFYSHNLLGWVLAAGDMDNERAIDLANYAVANPPLNDPFDRWATDYLFVPLPQHTLGVAYMNKGDFKIALENLEQAARIRPNDQRVADDLRECRSRLGS